MSASEATGGGAMRVVLINLDRDTRRLDWMTPQLDRLGLPVQRLSAFTPMTIPDEFRARFLPEAETRILPTNTASFSSHLAALTIAAEDDSIDWTLVLEDDVEIHTDAATLNEFAAIAANVGADIVRMSRWPKYAVSEVAQVGEFQVVRYLSTPRGAGAFLVSTSGARKILDRAQGLAITTDNFLKRESGRGLHTLGVVPPAIPQDRYGASSIDPSNVRESKRKAYFYRRAGGFTRASADRCAWLNWTGVFTIGQMLGKEATARLSGRRRSASS